MRATLVTFGVLIAVLADAAGVASVLVIARQGGSEAGVLAHWSALLTVALAAGAVALIVGYYIAQGLRRRIYNIEEAAALMAAGRLQHRVPRSGERDEIDQLADQFNQMGDKLEHQVGLLQRLAEENRRLAEDTERAATMEERQRLARDLHDSVSQQLFALSMMAQTALRLAEPSPVPVPAVSAEAGTGTGTGLADTPHPALAAGHTKLHETLTTIAELATAAQREMRALLLHLRPVDLAGRSLQEAAAGFLQAVEERYALRCVFTCDEDADIPRLIEENLFRILQEAVANVLKHAAATEIRVHLFAQASTYELSITDDGVGVAGASGPDSAMDSSSGESDGAEVSGNGVAESGRGDSYGLTAMRERAESLGGRFSLLPRVHGTTVTVVIPRMVTSQGMEESR